MAPRDLNGLHLSRRSLLRWGGIGAAALAAGALPNCDWGSPRVDLGPGAGGDLVPDPRGILDLPRGFRYRILSQEGKQLPDGREVPGNHDGMAAFSGGSGTTLLVRNHEQNPDAGAAVEGALPFDPEEAGGTTTLRIASNRTLVEEFVSLGGTRRNCAGGVTPWGTWLTCEETKENGHGYVFEVVPGDPENELFRQPIRGMGRFSHEAVGIDPSTGIAYLTEDDAPESFLFRYLPDNRGRAPGALHEGGQLQVLVIAEGEQIEEDTLPLGRSVSMRWADVDPELAHEDAETKGPVRFRKLEGAVFTDGALWFNDSSGGKDRLGQVLRFEPRSMTLELIVESPDHDVLHQPDNILITPWGDPWIVEDGSGPTRVMGVTPLGGTYEFARNALNDSELAGPCFSPDSSTFFVNIYEPGHTIAIWGPFEEFSARKRGTRPDDSAQSLIPRVTEDLHAAAARRGLSRGEAAAYESLGLPLL